MRAQIDTFDFSHGLEILITERVVHFGGVVLAVFDGRLGLLV